MTKLQMIKEIVTHTKIKASDKRLEQLISNVSKSRVEEVYNAFLKDKEHALFFYSVL